MKERLAEITKIVGCRCLSCGETDNMGVSINLKYLQCMSCDEKLLLVRSLFEVNEDGDIILKDSEILPYSPCSV